tara:strand:+ start:5048 stop:5509 length:462 start_codon:yes stop_codon:yes gene_type:complete
MINAIPDTVLVTLISLYAILALASVINFTLKRIKPDRDYRELTQRTNSWWIMITIFAIAIIADRVIAIIFLGFVSFLALKEYFSQIPTRRADRRVIFWAYLAIPFQYYWVHEYWYGMFIVFIPVWVFLFLPMRMLFWARLKVSYEQRAPFIGD